MKYKMTAPTTLSGKPPGFFSSERDLCFIAINKDNDSYLILSRLCFYAESQR
jgi:hypothetical protein